MHCARENSKMKPQSSVRRGSRPWSCPDSNMCGDGGRKLDGGPGGFEPGMLVATRGLPLIDFHTWRQLTPQLAGAASAARLVWPLRP
jgi:hypothetical protein